MVDAKCCKSKQWSIHEITHVGSIPTLTANKKPMIKKVKIAEVISNPNNPRLIKDDKFKKLSKVNTGISRYAKRPTYCS
jgi:hypothetical protein